MEEIACDADEAPCRCLGTDLFGLLGGKYALEVLCVVANHRPVRFGTVEDHVPSASTSTLSTRLDDLAEAGLIDRQRYDEIPPRVEYDLTADGEELAERSRPLVEWLAERDEAATSD